MGASSSADGTILKKKKVYKRLEPEKREKTRFDPLENSVFTSQHDASIDKVKRGETNYYFVSNGRLLYCNDSY